MADAELNQLVARIGNVSAPPGSAARGAFNIATRVDGTPVEIPFVVVNGNFAGPTLWLDGCLHGDEPAGARAVGKVIKRIAPESLRGTLIAIPVLNVSAFGAQSRLSPEDGKDMNRVFPGNDSGTFTDRYAHAVYKIALEHSDYYIGLHGSGTPGVCCPYSVYYGGGEKGQESERMAKATLIDLAFKGTGGLEGALYTNLASQGVPAVLIEAGGEGKVNARDVDCHVDGILNVMRHLGMLADQSAQMLEPQIFENAVSIKASTGGFLELEVLPGNSVVRDQVVARIYDVFGEEAEVARFAGDRGIVVSATTTGPIRAGTAICGVLV